jgi:hypothetical protein
LQYLQEHLKQGFLGSMLQASGKKKSLTRPIQASPMNNNQGAKKTRALHDHLKFKRSKESISACQFSLHANKDQCIRVRARNTTLPLPQSQP